MRSMPQVSYEALNLDSHAHCFCSPFQFINWMNFVHDHLTESSSPSCIHLNYMTTFKYFTQDKIHFYIGSPGSYNIDVRAKRFSNMSVTRYEIKFWIEGISESEILLRFDYSYTGDITSTYACFFNLIHNVPSLSKSKTLFMNQDPAALSTRVTPHMWSPDQKACIFEKQIIAMFTKPG